MARSASVALARTLTENDSRYRYSYAMGSAGSDGPHPQSGISCRYRRISLRVAPLPDQTTPMGNGPKIGRLDSQ